MAKTSTFNWKRVVLTSIVISIFSLITFTIFLHIYKEYKGSQEAKQTMLSIVGDINDGETFNIVFHGKTQRADIDDYTKMVLWLNPGVLSISEYTIHNLSNIPVYEIVFEWTPDVNPSDPGLISTSICTGKYRKANTRKWEYFSSPNTIRQDLRILASE